MNFQRKKKNNILIDARDDFTTILTLKKIGRFASNNQKLPSIPTEI